VNGKKSILIADADRELVTSIAMRCQFLGLETIKAYDARTAFELILEFAPDIICVDAEMQANGMSVCEVLSRDDEYSKIPAIILTNRKDSEVVRQCGQMCAYYIQKSSNVLSRIEPVIYELVDLAPLAHPGRS
jgi:DNA-binding response OmpR family regulator